MIKAGLALLILAAPVAAQDSENRLAALIDYCATSVALKDPLGVAPPDGLEPSETGVMWHDGTYSLRVGATAGHWTCDVVFADPAVMEQTGEAYFTASATEIGLFKPWENEEARFFIGQGCIADAPVLMVVNGGMAEEGGFGLFTATDRGVGPACRE